MNLIKKLFCLTVLAGLAFNTLAQSSLTNGLLAYYPFDGSANDASGNGNNGIPTAVTPATDRVGVLGGAYQFNRSNSVITVPSLASANLTELTLSVWVLPFTTPSVQGDIINKWRGFSYSLEDYALNILPDLRVTFGNGRHGTGYYALPNHCAIISTNPIALDRWFQLVATLDSSGTGKLWINGVLSAQDNILTLMPPATEPVRIGQLVMQDGSILDSFNGLIDDVRIYNRALSASEVQQLYLAEAGPIVSLIKALKPSFSNLTVSSNYQLQVSSDLSTWTNTGTPFNATSTNMVYPQYFDVANWSELFFRLRAAP